MKLDNCQGGKESNGPDKQLLGRDEIGWCRGPLKKGCIDFLEPIG